MVARAGPLGVAAALAAALAALSVWASALAPPAWEMTFVVGFWTLAPLAAVAGVAAIVASRRGRASGAALAAGVATLVILVALVAWLVLTLCGWGC